MPNEIQRKQRRETAMKQGGQIHWLTIPGAVLMMLFLGCGNIDSLENVSSNEDTGHTQAALITITTSAGAVTSGNCDGNNATVNTLDIAPIDVPWRSMHASGNWSVSGASGIQLVYSLDDNVQQVDTTNASGSRGSWSLDISALTCRERKYKLTVCGYPKIQSPQQTTICSSRPRCVSVDFDACRTAVGVIPDSAYCPAGSDLISITMDDEDYSNSNSSNGWKGATISNKNTTFYFCRMDGQNFRPLSYYDEIQWHYAVLKLGANCPDNSTEFQRIIDNEDHDNDNRHSGSIWPNDQSSSPGSWTRFRYCLFRNAASLQSVMPYFPNLGLSYGVFAGTSFSSQFALDSGYVLSDDEDNDNSNSFVFPSSPANTSLYARQIIQASSGTGTIYRMARVR